MKASVAELLNWLDRDEIQRLQESFYANTGMSIITLDLDGNPITRQTGNSSLCNLLYYNNTKAAALCRSCNLYGALETGKKECGSCYYCPMGLLEFSSPITIGDELVAYMIGGMVYEKKPSLQDLQMLSENYEISYEALQKAALKVPISNMSRIESAASFLYDLSHLLSINANAKLQTKIAQNDLERADQMKNDFLANMSHEIRTPMNAVIGMADIALQEKMSPAAEEYIMQIQNSGKSLLHIINDILDYSKISSGKLDILPEEYSPAILIRDVSTIIASRLQTKASDIVFIIDIDPHLPQKLLGDAPRIQQIMINLLNNAVKFTKKGCISMSVLYRRLNDKIADLEVKISDTGIGIKPADMEKLFKSFSQVDSKRNRNIEGTGLGLAIVQQLVDLMHGSVSVESQYEKGSTFTFHVQQEIITSDSVNTIKDPDQYSVAALINNEFVHQHFMKMADSLGINTRIIDAIDETLEEALEHWITEHSYRKNYFFIDAMLLTEKRIQLLQAFSTKHPEAVLIVLTNPFGSDYTIEENSIFTCVKKPFHVLDMIEILDQKRNRSVISTSSTGQIARFIAPTAKVLVVDDNAMNLRVAEKLLGLSQIRVDKASSGIAAIEMIEKERYDIIFMDHMMPELDGIDTTRIIRRFHPKMGSIPIIALTANAMEDARKTFIEEGMNDFIAKPIELRTLNEKLQTWLPHTKLEYLSEE